MESHFEAVFDEHTRIFCGEKGTRESKEVFILNQPTSGLARWRNFLFIFLFWNLTKNYQIRPPFLSWVFLPPKDSNFFLQI